ncbi:MAG: hypothetical protein ACR2M1_07595 [Gemmatimonadaceae bacterium]
MGHSLLAATPGVHPIASSSVHPGAAAWGNDASTTTMPTLGSASLAWPWPGGVVSTLDFDPQNEGDKAYTAIAIVRGGMNQGDGAIVDRALCLRCGESRVRISRAATFSDAALHLEAFQVWAGEFADVHDREECGGPYGDDSADAASVLGEVVATALGSPDAAAEFMGAFARSSLDVEQGEWGVLVTTPMGIRHVDAGLAGLASNVTLDGSPLTRDHDIDIRTVVARLGGAVAIGASKSVPVVVAVSSDGYDLGVGVRRWTILTPTRVFVCETGPDPEYPSTLGIAVGLDAYTRADGVRRFLPPDRVRVAMMLGDGFDLGAAGAR